MNRRAWPATTWTIARPRRWFRQAVAWLATTALLTLLLMPMTGGVGGVERVDGLTLVTLCTDEGPLQVALDGDGRSVPLPKSHHHAACPFCLAHAGYALASSALAVPVPADFVAVLRPALPVGTMPKAFFRTGCQSRAPPRPAV